MAEGTTSRYDPETGETTHSTFQYTPVAPPSPADQYSTVNPEYIKWAYQYHKIKEANDAIAAATQFQGIRGYQESVKAGDAPEKAMAKWGPMIFAQKPGALAGMIKQITPPVSTPHQAAQEALARERFEFAKKKPVAPVHVGGGLYSVNPATGKYEALTAPPPKVDEAVKSRRSLLESRIKTTRNLIARAPDGSDGHATWAPLIDSAMNDEEELQSLLKPATTPVSNQLTPSPAPAPAPTAAVAPAQEVIRITKDGKRAVFDSVTKRFLRYAPDS